MLQGTCKVLLIMHELRLFGKEKAPTNGCHQGVVQSGTELDELECDRQLKPTHGNAERGWQAPQRG